MPQFKSKVATLSVEISTFTATMSAKGYTLAGESRSDGSFAVTATKPNGSLAAVAEDGSAKAATNAVAAQLGIPGSPLFP